MEEIAVKSNKPIQFSHKHNWLMIEKTNIQVLAGARQQSMDHCKSNQAGDWTRILLTANSALVLYFITKDLLVQFALSSKTGDRIHLILLGKLLDFMFMSMSYQHCRQEFYIGVGMLFLRFGTQFYHKVKHWLPAFM